MSLAIFKLDTDTSVSQWLYVRQLIEFLSQEFKHSSRVFNCRGIGSLDSLLQSLKVNLGKVLTGLCIPRGKSCMRFPIGNQSSPRSQIVRHFATSSAHSD